MSRRDDRRADRGASSTAVREGQAGPDADEEPTADAPQSRRFAAEPVAAPTARRSFFDMYRPGQGHHTRIWSGVGAGVLVCWLAYFLYNKLELLGTGATAKYIQVGVAVGTILVFGLLLYWMLALNRRVCDFLIATEGEMKKVNWTSRKEIIGSTKVVVFVMIALAIVLFIVDIIFMLFFNVIGVLKGAAILDTVKKLFGLS
jgi:preprotein translocase subunit SecE